MAIIRTTARYVLAIVLAALPLASCNQETPSNSDQVSIVTSLPVLASIIQEVILPGDKVAVLLNENQSPHEYAPRPSDVKVFSKAQVVFLAHPDLDGWAEELGSTHVEYLSGFRSTFPGDPHFWFDPMESGKAATVVTEILCGISPAKCTHYEANLEVFLTAIISLDRNIRDYTESFQGRPIVTSHPFINYYLRRYKIVSIATLEPSPGHESNPASVIRVLELIEKGNPVGIVAQRHHTTGVLATIEDETGLPVVFVDPVGHSGLSYTDFMLKTTSSITSLIQK